MTLGRLAPEGMRGPAQLILNALKMDLTIETLHYVQQVPNQITPTVFGSGRVPHVRPSVHGPKKTGAAPPTLLLREQETTPRVRTLVY